MRDVAIKVEGIGKRYRLGVGSSMDRTFREMIYDTIRGVAKRNENDDDDRFVWALRDASFEVQRGEVVGVIGGNGAGKSTLLKVLSHITDPTTGQAEIHGRVCSLLEVGTGFHPELTGRENIFLNGAILGMRRGEIKSKLDEIVGFAEIDRFLDTPVKRYSSGMYVRLAFAVAAHLEPEILLVDEVLAVGDAKFQQKCLGKMKDVAVQGRTVLFVSHNMGAVETLCARGIVVRKGEIVADTDARSAIQSYLNDMEEFAEIDVADRTDRFGHGKTKLTRIEMFGDEDENLRVLQTGAHMRVVFHMSKYYADTRVVFSVFDTFGQPIVDFISRYPSDEDRWENDLGNKVICDIPELLLVPGHYRMDVLIYGAGHTQDKVEAATYFDVTAGQVRGRPVSEPIRNARAYMPQRWTMPA